MFRSIADNPLLLVVLLLIIVLVFGSKRLPDAARSMGRSMRIFKSEVKEMKEDDHRPSTTSSRPLEGRVVDESGTTGATGSTGVTGSTGAATRPEDRERADEPHRGA